MLLSRFLILMLICCVVAREDFSFLVTSLSNASPCHPQTHSDEEEATHEDGEAVFAPDDDSEAFDGGLPVRNESPSDDAEIPVVLEIDFDTQAEEMLCTGDHQAHFGFVGQCLLHEQNAFSNTTFTSFCTLKRLRT